MPLMTVTYVSVIVVKPVRVVTLDYSGPRAHTALVRRWSAHLYEVFWKDETTNNENHQGGTHPDGIYRHGTLIYYCCRSDAHPHYKIQLPTSKPFVLIRNHQDGCQEVEGTVHTLSIVTVASDAHSRSTGIYGTVKKDGLKQVLGYCTYEKFLSG